MNKLTISSSFIILVTAPILTFLIILLSIRYGTKLIDWKIIQAAFFHFNPDNIDHQIIISSRLPRVIGALFIGAALAVSGALMQGITGNYLASPGLMGVMDGSALAVTLGMIFLPNSSTFQLMAFSFLGSALGAGLVFGLGSLLPSGLSPVRLAILGAVTGTLLSGISAAITTYYQIAQDISFWYHTRLHQMNPENLKMAVIFMVVGFLMALWVSRTMGLFSLGDEIAISLGQRIVLIKGVAAFSVMLLTGASVALAGKIEFVGLIIPHITRYLVGNDDKRVIPCAGVLGGIFLAFSDLLSRFLNYPFETPVGVITTFVGVPFFLYLVRKRGDNHEVLENG
jgi:iron complex transport system permease protein